MMNRDVKCPDCSTLFGKEADRSLAIKHRDLYRTIVGGTVSGPCRGCGRIITWGSVDNDRSRTR